MKKLILSGMTILCALSLAACSNNNSSSNNSQTAKKNSSLRAKNSSLKMESKYSNSDFALMAYLKLHNQTASELNRNKDGMNWNQNGNQYSINFGAHTTQMTVNKNNVEITYDKAQNGDTGQGDGHKTYSKQQLIRQFGNEKSVLNEILSSVNKTNNSTNGNESSDNKANQNNNVTGNNSNENSNTSQNNNASQNKISSAQDAENLIEHSMHMEPGTAHATQSGDGYSVDTGAGSATVHSDGSVTWDNGDTQPYGDLSAPTSDN